MSPLPLIKSIPHLCMDIAIEHLAECDAQIASHTTPLPGGRVVTSWDGQASMKAALVAIEFSLAHIEAITWEAINVLHPKETKAYDRVEVEKRLTKLGITDPAVHAGCAVLRELHKELFHNKPSTSFLVAQREATNAFALARKLNVDLSALVNAANKTP